MFDNNGDEQPAGPGGGQQSSSNNTSLVRGNTGAMRSSYTPNSRPIYTSTQSAGPSNGTGGPGGPGSGPYYPNASTSGPPSTTQLHGTPTRPNLSQLHMASSSPAVHQVGSGYTSPVVGPARTRMHSHNATYTPTGGSSTASTSAAPMSSLAGGPWEFIDEPNSTSASSAHLPPGSSGILPGTTSPPRASPYSNQYHPHQQGYYSHSNGSRSRPPSISALRGMTSTNNSSSNTNTSDQSLLLDPATEIAAQLATSSLNGPDYAFASSSNAPPPVPNKLTKSRDRRSTSLTSGSHPDQSTPYYEVPQPNLYGGPLPASTSGSGLGGPFKEKEKTGTTSRKKSMGSKDAEGDGGSGEGGRSTIKTMFGGFFGMSNIYARKTDLFGNVY